MPDDFPVTTVPSQTETELRNLAKWAQLIAIASICVLLAALLRTLDALTLIEPFTHAIANWDWGLWGATWVDLLHRITHVIPISLYLLAVLGAAGILDQIGKGEYFSPRNIRALGDMGGAMLWGAIWAIFLVPSISAWTGGEGGGYRVDLSSENLVIATIGLCLLVIGRLFLRAQKLEAEMEAIV